MPAGHAAISPYHDLGRMDKESTRVVWLQLGPRLQGVICLFFFFKLGRFVASTRGSELNVQFSAKINPLLINCVTISWNSTVGRAFVRRTRSYLKHTLQLLVIVVLRMNICTRNHPKHYKLPGARYQGCAAVDPTHFIFLFPMLQQLKFVQSRWAACYSTARQPCCCCRPLEETLRLFHWTCHHAHYTAAHSRQEDCTLSTLSCCVWTEA